MFINGRDAMDELLTEFLKEAPELVQQATDDLQVLDNDPGNAERIDSAFRAIHTLKGSVALFDFAVMGSMLHIAEDVLGAARSRKVGLSRSRTGALLDCVDACDRWVAEIGHSGKLPAHAEVEASRIIVKLREDRRETAETAEVTTPLSDEVDFARDSAMRSVRVDVRRIDELVNILGDLVVAKNTLAHLARTAADLNPHFARELAKNQSEVSRLVGAMQRSVMQVRMVPLSRTFQRFPRLVREIAGKLGKSISLRIIGDEIEADRSIVDALFDPLLHVLRNAADHGIEDALMRERLGKPPAGEIVLEASHDGDQIVVTIRDDGRGIDTAKLRQHAKSSRPENAASIDALSNDAAMALVFSPGVSTADVVSDISGRGVGMDAARKAVEALGGRMELASSSSSGTVISLRFPQVAVIANVILIEAGGEQFGVPIHVLQETARIRRADVKSIKDGRAFVLRNRTIALISLAELLKLGRLPVESDDAKILLVKSGDQIVGVEVDAIGERIEVMQRPPTGMLAQVQGMRASALLGDGSVLLILDLAELAA